MFCIEYTFQKLDNTTCTPRGEEFTDLEEAKNVCKKKASCKGVLHRDYSDDTKYSLCSFPGITRSDKYIKSNYYQKDKVGKTFIKSNHIGNESLSKTVCSSNSIYAYL